MQIYLNENKISKRIIALSVAVLIVISLIIFYLYKQHKYKPAHIPNISTAILAQYNMHGIDVSKYQGDIDWETLATTPFDNKQMRFSFIKATEGLDITDEQFKDNWKNAKEAGLTRGAYHFFIAGISGKLQALHFIQKVFLEKSDLPPVIDIEETYDINSDTLRYQLQECLTIIEEHYKIKPIIYTSVHFHQQYLKSFFVNYPLWIAHYTSNSKPNINVPWLFWQHTNTGMISGIDKNVDFNVFNGDSLAFAKIRIQ